MDSLTDPPPDESNTRPIESAQLPRRKGFWFWILLLLAPVILGLLKPVIISSHPPSFTARREAISNIKEIALALCEFDQDYGQYPNAATIEMVKKKDPHAAASWHQNLQRLFPPIDRRRMHR